MNKPGSTRISCQYTKISHPFKVIDGVKIRCIGTHYTQWIDSPFLSFSTKVDEQTGEIKSETKTAFYRGLHFFIIQSTISDEVHCILRGSLAKYYNNGLDNGFDFTRSMLQDTIRDLQKKFKINPYEAIVQHFEYGLNVYTENSPKAIVSGLRAYQSDCFTFLRLDEVFTGIQLKKVEYQFKVYNKGIQLPKKQDNLLRIELAVKSTKKAKKYGIEVLADLVKVQNLNAVKPDFLKIWEDSIFYDSGMKWRLMNKKQKEKMLYYLDATNWEKFNRKQRFRAKQLFIELRDKFCSSKTQTDILNKITVKIENLTAEKGNALRNFYKEYEAEKRERFTHLDKGVKRGQILSENSADEIILKSVKIKLPKCKVCRIDISHKKTGSIYCSKTCNNSDQAKKRKKKRRQKTTIEIKHLNRLIKILPKYQLRLLITFKLDGVIHSLQYNQRDVQFNQDDIRSIHQIQIEYPENIKLTSYRARDLIKAISISNCTT